jgi:hypothetical protein
VKTAAKDLVLISVDMSDRKTNQAIASKYGVSGLPAMFLTDSEGKVTGKMNSRDAAGVAAQFREHAEKYSRSIPWAESLDAAIKSAKETPKPVIVFFTDGKADSKAMEAAFTDTLLKKTLPGFALFRHKIKRDCELCKRFKVTKGPRVQILDPTAEDPAKRPLAKINGKKDAAKLKKALESALKKFTRSLSED